MAAVLKILDSSLIFLMVDVTHFDVFIVMDCFYIL